MPRNDKPLVAIKPERVRRLREHLLKVVQEMRDEKHWARSASTARPKPTRFPARVAQRVCALCKGWCCRNGDDDGFLDARTLARVRVAKLDITDSDLLHLYLGRVPAVAYRDSCIFHGKQGCTLDRSLRAENLQLLLLWRPRHLHENRSRHSDKDHRWRRRKDEDVGGSDPHPIGKLSCVGFVGGR